jgi:hypothetical protein
MPTAFTNPRDILRAAIRGSKNSWGANNSKDRKCAIWKRKNMLMR